MFLLRSLLVSSLAFGSALPAWAQTYEDIYGTGGTEEEESQQDDREDQEDENDQEKSSYRSSYESPEPSQSEPDDASGSSVFSSELSSWSAALVIGLGGDADYQAGTGPEVGDDLETTLGLAGRYQYELTENASIGGFVALLSWNSDDVDAQGIGRSTLFDMAFFAKGRVPFTTTLGETEVYGIAQMGPCLSFLDGDFEQNNWDVGAALGWTIGIFAGGSVDVSPGIRMFFDLGYLWHLAEHEVNTPAGQFDFDVSLGQPTFLIGATF